MEGFAMLLTVYGAWKLACSVVALADKLEGKR